MKVVIEPHILENAFLHRSPVHKELMLEMCLFLDAAKCVREKARQSPVKLQPGKIFISYKWIDRSLALQVKGELEKAGYKSWYDEDRLNGGVDWRREIEEEISKAIIFVTCLSDVACKSTGVFWQELYFALGRQRSHGPKSIFIIPLRHGQTEIPSELTSLRILSLGGKGWLENLKEAIGIKLDELSSISRAYEERARPGICLDGEPGSSTIALKYLKTFRNNKQFWEWRSLIEEIEGLRYESLFYKPSWGDGLKDLAGKSSDKKGCREEDSDIFLWVALGAIDAYLITEGGIAGECKQKHKWDNCPTRDLLCGERRDFVLSAQEAIARLQELRRNYEKQLGL